MCLWCTETAQSYSLELRGAETFDSLHVATQWMESCCQLHEKCRIKQSDWLPTRLLDIVDDRIRIVLSSEALPNAKYATLSHCWGNVENIKLTKSTFESLRKGVNISQLPLSFRHAVKVARTLNLRYLWIDSLCIIQGDDSDWLREALLMYRVYAESHVTIAATAAKHSGDGLCFTRDPDIEFLPVKVTLPDTSRWTGGVSKTYVVNDSFYINELLDQEPLIKRGWVVQERFLAPRVIHFGSKQLVWECREKFLCERHPLGLPSSLHGDDFVIYKGAFCDDQILDSAYHHYWDQLVRTYTRCSLTKSSDKTVALSGIVRYVQAKIRDEYIAGMWRGTLAQSLVWFVRRADQKSSSRPLPYRAPTWSWLSVDGSVVAHGYAWTDDCLHVRVLEVDMDYLTPDKTGPIESGVMLLAGHLRQIQVLTNDKFDEYRFRFTMVLQNEILLNSHTYMDWFLDVHQSDFEESNNKRELYLMPCVGEDHQQDMLLLKCVDTESGTYERLGIILAIPNYRPGLMDTIMERDDDDSSIPHYLFDDDSGYHAILLR